MLGNGTCNQAMMQTRAQVIGEDELLESESPKVPVLTTS